MKCSSYEPRSARRVGFALTGFLLVLAATLGVTGTARAQTPVPSPVPTPSGPIVITVTPNTSALSCFNSTSVSVSMTIGGTAAPNGTQIIISANAGTVAPAIVHTSGGSGSFTYFAPAGASGTATLTATSMGGSGTANIALFCGTGGGGGVPNLPGAVLGAPVITCFGGQASVTFNWTGVAGADSQWVDLTLFNNGFAPGTFVGFGPLSGTTNQIQWNGLVAGQTHWYRVSAGVPGAGWVFSQTGAFTPCGSNPAVGATTFVCTGGGRANVTFGVGANPAGTTTRFVDISLFNNGFAPGTFIGGNATSVTTSFVWTNVQANALHWWRVNNLTPFGWVTSTTGSFFASC